MIKMILPAGVVGRAFAAAYRRQRWRDLRVIGRWEQPRRLVPVIGRKRLSDALDLRGVS